MSTILRCLMVGCLTVVCGCAVQQGGRGEKSGVAAQETRYAGFASQLGEQMEGTIASVEKTPFGGPAEVSVGRPVCFRAPDAVPQGHIDGSPQGNDGCRLPPAFGRVDACGTDF